MSVSGMLTQWGFYMFKKKKSGAGSRTGGMMVNTGRAATGKQASALIEGDTQPSNLLSAQFQ